MTNNHGKARPEAKPTAENIRERIPALYRHEQVESIMREVEVAAAGDTERRLFRSVVRRAREELYELEALHRYLPEVLAGEHQVREHFHYVLELAAARLPYPGPLEMGEWGPGFLTPAPGGLPCGMEPFLNPRAIFHLTLALDHVYGRDPERYHHCVNVVGRLWSRADEIERIYRSSVKADVGPDSHVGELLRMHVRNLEESGWLGDGLSGPGILPPEGGFGHPEFPPPDGAPWPGPDDGPSIPRLPGTSPPFPKGPDLTPGGRLPKGPRDPCEMLEDICRKLVLAGAKGLRRTPLPISTWAHTITGLAPEFACEGEPLTIQGTFEPVQPPNVVVIIGADPVDVISWSETEIVIRIPIGGKPGCVGFRDEGRENQRRVEWTDRQNEVGGMLEGLGCLGHAELIPQTELPYVTSAAPCTGLNYFAGVEPVIDLFEINGSTDLLVEPGTKLELTWGVKNAQDVKIRRTSTTGPSLPSLSAVTLFGGYPHKGTIDLGAFNSSAVATATYELTAANPCKTVTATVRVRVRSAPDLKVLGIEVVQAIQRFDLANPAQNNSVRLATRRRTMARVYVDSGLKNGFDYAAGPNAVPITGTLTLWRGLQHLGTVKPIPTLAGSALPAPDRKDITHSLNFLLPWNVLDGALRLDVNVQANVGDLGSGQGWFSIFSGPTVNFIPRKPTKLYKILIQDLNNLGQAGNNFQDLEFNWWVALDGAKTRFPVSDSGWEVWLISGAEQIHTSRNLNTHEGWEDLIDDLEDIADDAGDPDGALAGLLPANGNYKWGGKAQHPKDHDFVITWQDDNRVFAVQPNPMFFAHELTHTFSIDHANCGNPGHVDPGLPVIIEDHGADLYAVPPVIIEAGTSELMSYCDEKGARWPSIVLWDKLFDQL